MPQMRDVSRLNGYFSQLVARYEREHGLSAQSRVRLPDDSTATGVYHSQLAESYAAQQRAGLIVPTSVPRVWRPTWRMAFQIAAGAISPGSEFVKRRVLARGERLQRDLDGDPTRTSAERIGARTGWTMLGVGLLLAVVAVAMAPTMSTVVMTGMMLAWWVAGRRGRTPGWRAILIGGLAATLLLGVPVGLAQLSPPVEPWLTTPDAAASLGWFVLPLVMLVFGTALLVEGFRAAAT
jgi:hypothetical protein